jgi:hypothetical protein
MWDTPIGFPHPPQADAAICRSRASHLCLPVTPKFRWALIETQREAILKSQKLVFDALNAVDHDTWVARQRPSRKRKVAFLRR